MVADTDKFQMMFLGLKVNKRFCLDINGNIIESTDTVKLLGVTIDSKLNFRDHVTHVCKKTNQKTRAFSRIARYLDVDKATLSCIYPLKLQLLPVNLDVLWEDCKQYNQPFT